VPFLLPSQQSQSTKGASTEVDKDNIKNNQPRGTYKAGELHDATVAVRRRLTATGTHVPYGITQYYLLPGRGDIPTFTPAEAGTQLSDPGGMQG